MTSPLKEIARQLGRMHSPGAFATHRTGGPKDLHLSVEGMGRISLPVPPASAHKLCAIARRLPRPTGRVGPPRIMARPSDR